MLGQHLVAVWSTTQAVLAFSSGETELYAMVKGASRRFGLISLAADFCIYLHGLVKSDAAAAVGIVNRTGVGKLRHVNVQHLWLQDQPHSGPLGPL